MPHRFKVSLLTIAFVGLWMHADFSCAESPRAPSVTEETRAEATLATEQPEPAPVDQPAEKVDADRAVPAPAKPLNKDHGSSPKDDDSQPQTSEPKRLRFNFRYQPWADVLDWFADQAGYSLVLDNPPKGTFNYRDDRAYTPAEAIDLLNSVLLTKGYTLVIRDRMLLVVNLEDEIPPALVAQVPAEQLDQRGKYELVSTRFQLKNLAAEEAQKEIEKLLGPQGQIVVLPKARQLVVMETGGRLREIRDVLERADRARDPAEQVVRWFDLTSVSPDEAVAMLRQIFEIPEDANATPDGSLHLATDPIGLRLLASGTAQRIEQVSKILATIDQSAFGESVETGRQAPLQLEVYDVAPADPESVLRVMQTLLADIPGTRLATDPKTGNLIAFARPTEQATVRATIDQLRHDAQSVEVIQLRVLDPQLAVLAIGKLFGKDSDKAPSIDADVANRQLLIRGSAGQIAQIRILLEKMGETSGAEATLARGRLRLVPLGGDEAQELIDRLQAVWPAVGSNELRIVPTREPKGQGGSRPRGTRRGRVDERTPVPGSASPSDSPDASSRQPATTQRPKPVPTLKGRKVRAMFAAIQTAADEDTPDPSSREDANNAAKPPILVLPTPNGLYVSSEDVQALDELQKLIDTLQGGATSNEPKLTVFYLRNAEAKTVAERLNQLLAGTTPAASSGGKSDSAPTGILGNLGAAGTLGRITPSGPISITPDERLNALLVQAAPADVDMLEEVLRILDRRDSPEEIPAQPKPRLIPVVHTSASEIAQVVKDVYQEQLASSSGGNRSLSPPEMMMQMFRRGRGRGSDNSGSRNNQQTASKMSIGVDSRTNSLIVSAPEPLFEEVRELVNALDRVASQDNETVEVVALRESNPEAVRAALASLLGDSVQSTTASGTGGAQTGSATPWWNASRARGSTGRSNWGSARQGSPQPQGRQRSGSFPGSRSQPGQRGGR